jgi:hypothetical protein
MEMFSSIKLLGEISNPAIKSPYLMLSSSCSIIKEPISGERSVLLLPPPSPVSPISAMANTKTTKSPTPIIKR